MWIRNNFLVSWEYFYIIWNVYKFWQMTIYILWTKDTSLVSCCELCLTHDSWHTTSHMWLLMCYFLFLVCVTSWKVYHNFTNTVHVTLCVWVLFIVKNNSWLVFELKPCLTFLFLIIILLSIFISLIIFYVWAVLISIQ